MEPKRWLYIIEFALEVVNEQYISVANSEEEAIRYIELATDGRTCGIPHNILHSQPANAFFAAKADLPHIEYSDNLFAYYGGNKMKRES